MTLLIYPPAAKPCEPSAGLARLAGALKAHFQSVQIWDANQEAIPAILQSEPAAADRWTRQAWASSKSDLQLLQGGEGYRHFSRYNSGVRHLNRLLAVNSSGFNAVLSLADFQHRSWSPLRSDDLLAAAAAPERSPFHVFFQSRLQARFADHRPKLIGISLNYLSQALPAFALIGLLRRDYPGIPIVLGGGLLTSWMRRPGWQNPFGGLVDHLVDGPGEAPLLRLSGVESPAPAAFLPDFSGLDWRQYFAPGPILPYDAARGCYWNRCAFCPEPAEGHSYQPLPAWQVLADLHQLTAAHRPAIIHFTDNALSPTLLRALIKDPPGVPWYGFVRITPQLSDPDFCRGLKKSGCAMLKIGLESGDDAVLEGMQKGVNAEQAGLALQALAAAKVATYIYLLFGTPWEDEAAALRTLAFVNKHTKAITFINPAIFNLPLNAMSDAKLELKSFYTGDLQLYSDFSHPLGWGRKEVRHFLDRTFKRDPAAAAILRRTPPCFTSNHAAFFAESWMAAAQ